MRLFVPVFLFLLWMLKLSILVAIDRTACKSTFSNDSKGFKAFLFRAFQSPLVCVHWKWWFLVRVIALPQKIKIGSQLLLKEARLEREGRCAHIWFVFVVVSLLVDLTNNPLTIVILAPDSCDLSIYGAYMVVHKWFVDNCTYARHHRTKLYFDSTQSGLI